jgi:hypothetical protein
MFKACRDCDFHSETFPLGYALMHVPDGFANVIKLLEDQETAIDRALVRFGKWT